MVVQLWTREALSWPAQGRASASEGERESVGKEGMEERRQQGKGGRNGRIQTDRQAGRQEGRQVDMQADRQRMDIEFEGVGDVG